MCLLRRCDESPLYHAALRSSEYSKTRESTLTASSYGVTKNAGIEFRQNHTEMTLRVWILFLMMETMACLSPGPAVLLVISQGLSRGVFASLWSSCGILAANACYFAVSATGIAAVLLGSKNLFNLIAWIGAGYTIWLGVRTFASSGTAVCASARPSSSSARMFTNGFVLQISKPGLLLFFVAVLPQFILPGSGVAGQVLILAVTSIVVEFAVLSLYGALAARLGKLAVGARFVALANRLSGLMLIVAAVALARSRL